MQEVALETGKDEKDVLKYYKSFVERYKVCCHGPLTQ